jgi:tRNA(Ile2) C34 agmatinyltransferase TiaS
MARKYKPIQLDVKPVADVYMNEAATCPQCSSRITEVRGRMGLRLVFRCDRCRVQFFRQRASTSASLV